MIKVVIIDDEPLARSLVREYLASYDEVEICAECGDGFEGLKAIAQHRPFLIFLDIQMPKINGFEMLELVENPPAIIFTTAFDEYAMKAFEFHALDYLLKPFSKERFDKAMKKWIGLHKQGRTQLLSPELHETIKQPEERTRIVVKEAGNIKIIPINEVLYLEAYDDYVKIFTAKEMFLKKKTMNYYEQTLESNQFVRVHRSYIIQLSQLTKLEPAEKDTYEAVLKSGTRIPLSKTGYTKLKAALGI
jgi:two-component system, LytTR family, response regulator